MIENKIFELYWSWYEEYSPYLLFHENKTKEEFEQDVKKYLIKYGDEYLEKEDGWIGASDWIQFIYDKLPELGYIKINPIATGFFGAYIIDGDNEEDIKWKEIVGEELYQKAVRKNKLVREKMDKEFEEYEKANVSS